jgi:hypothetical protein
MEKLESTYEEPGGGVEVRVNCLNQDLQDERISRILKYPENLKILKILIQMVI